MLRGACSSILLLATTYVSALSIPDAKHAYDTICHHLEHRDTATTDERAKRHKALYTTTSIHSNLLQTAHTSVKTLSKSEYQPLYQIQKYAYNALTAIHRKDPAAWFSECDNTTCPLRRKTYPYKRRAYEDTVVNHLIHAYEHNNGRIEYVSFGSGLLLPDFHIIGLVLYNKPDAQITLHCIDPGNASRIDTSHGSVRINNDDATIDPIKQLQILYNTAFTSESLQIWVHDSHTSYIHTRNTYPDLIGGCDILTPDQKPLNEYLSLVMHDTQENGTTKGVALLEAGLGSNLFEVYHDKADYTLSNMLQTYFGISSIMYHNTNMIYEAANTTYASHTV